MCVCFYTNIYIYTYVTHIIYTYPTMNLSATISSMVSKLSLSRLYRGVLARTATGTHHLWPGGLEIFGDDVCMYIICNNIIYMYIYIHIFVKICAYENDERIPGYVCIYIYVFYIKICRYIYRYIYIYKFIYMYCICIYIYIYQMARYRPLDIDMVYIYMLYTHDTYYVSGFRVCKGIAFTSRSLQYTVVCKSSFGLPSQSKKKNVHIVNSANEIS